MALRTLNESEWKKFFADLGIPEEHSKTYAKTFAEQQVSPNLLKFISDKELQETFGVQLIGHRLAIIHGTGQQVSSVEPTMGRPTNSIQPQVRHQAPQLKPTMSPSSFRAFTSHWTVYKRLVGIPHQSTDAAAQIFSLACTDNPDIRRTIADHRPDHLLLNETDYLEMLRKLLTARATPETYHNKLFNMVQAPEETCQQWLKRLQEVSPDCEFVIPCTHNSNTFHKFDDIILRSKFILGMHNAYIKQELLAKSMELPTLDAVFNHATRIEATSRDLGRITSTVSEIQLYEDESPTSSDEEVNRISNYKKLRKVSRVKPQGSQSHKNRPCDGCGSNQHTSEERSSKCAAWKKVCNRCKRKGHFATVCRSQKNTEYANAVIAEVNIKSAASNEIEILMTAEGKYTKKNVPVMVYPDTGATLCVAGFSILSKLGITTSHLKKTSRHITTATGGKIHCRGWFQAKLTIGQYKTLQDVYVCDNIQRVFLSKTGCIELGMVHKDFPKPLNLSFTNTSVRVKKLPPRPNSIPFPATNDNIPKLKNYLLKAFSQTAFNDDKEAYFPKMTGVPKARIHLKEGVEPFFRGVPNRLPYYWRDATKKLLDQHVKRGIISKTPVGTPTPWCFPMVVTPKKSSTPLNPKLRMTIDLQNLNSKCIRELHHVESPFKLASRVPTNSFKTLLDAVDGYQAIELDEESQPLTTFITDWGAYHFLRVPAGLIDSGDKYTSRYDQIIQHIPRKVKCVDDTLLFDTSISEAFFHTFDYLHKCASHGIVFNSSKFQFCQRDVTFAGFTLTPSGIKPSDSIITAIRDFPTPRSTTDVRSWFGLVRQVAYAHSVSEDLAPLRCLLKHKGTTNPKFVWNDQLQQAFDKSKLHIVESVKRGIQTFDPKRQTCLQCDWSKNGIGFLLLQKHCICDLPDQSETSISQCCESGWRLIYAGSRFTTDVESRYAPTEGEALAVAWALQTSRMFTLGCPNLIIVTDHKPLLGLLNGRDLASIPNPRLRRIKEHTLEFSFIIKHCPGKLHLGADALSRHPAKALSEQTHKGNISEICEDQIGLIIDHAIYNISGEDSQSLTAITLDKVKLECLQDPEYVELHTLVSNGFPEKKINVPDHAKVYWALAQKGSLSTHSNIVLYQDRPVIPKSLRSPTLRILHSAHQGCTGMIARASSSIFWPGIRKSILSYQTNCRSCIEIAPSQPREPIQMSSIPQRPFQVVCADICQVNGRYYLIVVDRFSGFMHIFYSKQSPTHHFLQHHLRDIFTRYGRPDQLDTDGGPQFQAEPFLQFLTTWGTKHRVSAPYYPQSNGRAELGVKTAKRLLKENTGPDGRIDNNKIACAVLQYHNTPLRDGPMSPAQLLFGRALADFLPVNPTAYELHPYWSKQLRECKQRRHHHYNKLAARYNVGTRKLQGLTVGQTVIIQHHATKRWDRMAVVLEALPYRRYKLQLTDTGNTTIRNRRFLKPAKPAPHQQTACPAGPTCKPTRHMTTSNTPDLDEEEGEEYIPVNYPDQLLPTAGTTASRSNPNETAPSEAAPSARLPLALRQLQPYNKPGLRE